jgi:hypothetical protein
VTLTGDWAQRQPLHTFAASALDEDDSTSTPEYLFLQRQLELYGNLCLGRHEQNIRYITVEHRHLTWEEVVMAAMSDFSAETGKTTSILVRKPRGAGAEPRQRRIDNDGGDSDDSVDLVVEDPTVETPTRRNGVKLQRLPQSLRAMYVALIRRLFVDVGTNRDVLTDLELTFDWNSVTTTYFSEAGVNQRVALSGATFDQFPVLKRWVKSVLDGTTSMVHEDQFQGKPRNLFLAAVLKLLHSLIVFGYYADPADVTDLMGPLKGVLDGRNDSQLAKAQPSATPDVGGRKPSVQRRKEARLSVVSAGAESIMSTRSTDGDGGVRPSEEAEWLANGRFKIDDNGRYVVAAKLGALKCVEALLNFVTNVRMRQLLVDFKLTMVDQSPGKEYLGSSMAAIEARSDEMTSKFKTSDKLRHAGIKAHRAFLRTLTKQSDLSHAQLCDMNADSQFLGRNTHPSVPWTQHTPICSLGRNTHPSVLLYPLSLSLLLLSSPVSFSFLAVSVLSLSSLPLCLCICLSLCSFTLFIFSRPRYSSAPSP